MLVLLISPAAASDVIVNFTLDGVKFSDGGTATGGFTFDLTTGLLSNIDITTSDSGPLGFGLGYTYTGGGTFSKSSSSASFDFNDWVLLDEDLQLNLAAVLTASNLGFPDSFALTGREGSLFVSCIAIDQDAICDSRTVTAGSLDATPASATPLPAALQLFAGGLG